MRCEGVYRWTCVAWIWSSRALHGGPLAAGSPWPQRWASGNPGSPSPHPETRSHRGGSRGWWEAAGYVQGPLRNKWKERNLMKLPLCLLLFLVGKSQGSVKLFPPDPLKAIIWHVYTYSPSYRPLDDNYLQDKENCVCIIMWIQTVVPEGV